MFEVRATTQNFSPAITEIEAATRAGRLRQDGHPVLEWCLGDVVGKQDPPGNLSRTKQRADQKMDAAVALLMTTGMSEGSERWRGGSHEPAVRIGGLPWPVRATAACSPRPFDQSWRPQDIGVKAMPFDAYAIGRARELAAPSLSTFAGKR